MPAGHDHEPTDGGDLVPYTRLHRDGSVWAVGQTRNGQPEGSWEWFRVDGTMMRSGSFESGEQVGEWVTYNKDGVPHKTTVITRR